MKRILFLFLVATALISCKKVENSSVFVSPETHLFSHEGGTVSLLIGSNASWSATCEDKSISIEPASGSGTSTVRVVVPENLKTQTMLYRVNVKAKNSKDSASTKFLITQAAPPFIKISYDHVTVLPSGGGFQLDLESNSPWHIAAADPQIVIYPSEGESNATINISLDENTTGQERLFSVVFALKNHQDKEAELFIKQSN